MLQRKHVERFLEWSVESYFETFVDMNKDLVSRLKEFMENEARSCSMDFGCITPSYIYRMLGGQYPLEEIVKAMLEIRRKRTEG
jgi:hypothetical protein